MAEYEYNADLWYWRGHEYRRGDTVTIPDDLSADDKTFIASLVEQGHLVDPGHAEQLRKEREQADQARADREARQVELADEEARRVVDHNERRLTGGGRGDNQGSDASSDTGEPAPKAAPRRSSGK